MHTYVRPTTIPEPLVPSFADLRFRDALDVVAYAELDLGIGLHTWPEVWHLDEDGGLTCAGPRSSCNTMKRWARGEGDLYEVRRNPPAGVRCGDRWVIVDSRRKGFYDPPTVDEGDVRAFGDLRRKLTRVGVDLVDAVVFDDDGHWWSLHELTSETTAWTASVA